MSQPNIPAAGQPTPSAGPHPPRLLDQVREAIRLRHYSIRTEQSYTDWIKRYILFHHKHHPKDMGAAEVEQFLTHLAVVGKVAASTQNQALSALLFLYKAVLGVDLPWLDEVTRAKKPQRLPVVLTVEEVRRVLARMDGQHGLMADLLYGAGLRLLECVRLRVKDVDFGFRQITVRDGKGGKDRVTMLPQGVVEPLRAHLDKLKVLHDHELEEGFRRGLAAGCAGTEVSERGAGMGLAICVPGGAAVGRSAFGQTDAASCGRAILAAGHEKGGAGGGVGKTSQLPYLAPQLCHAFVAVGL